MWMVHTAGYVNLEPEVTSVRSWVTAKSRRASSLRTQASPMPRFPPEVAEVYSKKE